MALEMKKQTVETEVLISRRSTQLSLQADAMVSGAGRDAAETLMEEASVRITGTTVQDGRMSVEGVVVCQAAYRQRESEVVRAVEARAALQHVFEDDAIRAGMNGNVKAAVVHVEAGFLNGRILFRITVELKAQVWGVETTEVITQAEGIDGIEMLTEEVESVRCGAEAVAHTSLSETLMLPRELETQSTLMDFASTTVEKAERDLGGVRVTGHVNAEVLIAGEAAGRPLSMVKYAMPFSVLVEMPEWLTEHVYAWAAVESIRSSLVDAPEGGVNLMLECELNVWVRALQMQKIICLTDAYGTGETDLTVAQMHLKHTCRIQEAVMNESYRGTLLLPSAMPPAGAVLAARARASVTGTARENNADMLEGVLEICVIYMPVGGETPVSVRDELPFRVRSTKEVPDGVEIGVCVSMCEASALMNDRLDVRCALQFTVSERQEATVPVASDVQAQAVSRGKPGIVLVWPGKGDTQWSIGRRYRIPVQRVADACGGDVCAGKAMVLRI